MSDDIKSKWDKRYQNISGTITAAEVLSENLHLLPDSGDALDLACGRGGNALLLAKQGLRSHAWDISDVALQTVAKEAKNQKLDVCIHQKNVEQNLPAENSFDIIVVSYFLDRRICANLIKALRPQGVIFYQTFCKEKLSDKGPGHAEFLLERNELLSLFSDLKILYYREDNRCGNLHEGLRDTAQFIGQKEP